jgi:TRAP-type mannitol/chloroaromatic compound transport system substrate-binding protein
MINLEKWSQLPKSYQAIVTAAAGFANVEQTARYDARNSAALKRLVAAGTQLRPFSQPIMEACLKASREVNAETSAINTDYKKVWDSIEVFRNDEYLWWQVAEFSYDNFMIRTGVRVECRTWASELPSASGELRLSHAVRQKAARRPFL